MKTNKEQARDILCYFTATTMLPPLDMKDRPLITHEECLELARGNPYSYDHIRGIFPDEMYFKRIGIDTPDIN